MLRVSLKEVGQSGEIKQFLLDCNKLCKIIEKYLQCNLCCEFFVEDSFWSSPSHWKFGFVICCINLDIPSQTKITHLGNYFDIINKRKCAPQKAIKN